MCGSLNPDCLLGRFGQKANFAFSDSELFLYLEECSEGKSLMARDPGGPAPDLPAGFCGAIFLLRIALLVENWGYLQPILIAVTRME